MISKKIFIIAGSFFVLLVLLSGGWYFLREDNKKPIEIVNEEAERREEPKEQKQEGANLNSDLIRKIAEGEINSVVFDRDKRNVLYYNNNNFLKLTPGKEVFIENLESYPFKNIKNIKWSFDRSRTLIQTEEGFKVFNLSDGEVADLKGGIKEAGWNILEGGLVYHFQDKENDVSEIDVSDAEGGNWKKIIDTDFAEISLKTRPESKEVLYYPKNNKTEKEKGVFLVDLTEREKTELIEWKEGFDCKWSPSGDKLLISHKKEEGLDLGYLDMKNDNYYTFNFPTTIEKCAWSEDEESLYCGMITGFSSQGEEDGDLLKSWQEENFYSQDTFWKIDIETGKKERLIDTIEEKISVDAVNLLVNKKEDKLYFIDRKTRDLMELQI
ncbi:MAG: hypothetical protein ACOCUF_01485 [Patescibacteria group bacterium]